MNMAEKEASDMFLAEFKVRTFDSFMPKEDFIAFSLRGSTMKEIIASFASAAKKFGAVIESPYLARVKVEYTPTGISFEATLLDDEDKCNEFKEFLLQVEAGGVEVLSEWSEERKP
jgi:hypothetical protein